MRKVFIQAALISVAFIGLTESANASAIETSFTATGTNATTGNGLSANVRFVQSASTLKVILTNTSNLDVMEPSDVLTGVYFKFNTLSPTLVANTAFVGSTTNTVTPGNPSGLPNSYVISSGNNPSPGGTSGSTISGPGTDVGSEFAFRGNLAGNVQYGISSSGLGLFGPGDRFDTSTNLQGPADPDGIQYGITSAGDNINTGNGGIFGQHLVKNTVVFELTGWSFQTVSDLANLFSMVRFQYGTALSEPTITPPEFLIEVPVPTGVVLMGLGGVLLAGYSARKSLKKVQLA